ncbi:hypothetical protein QJ48_20985 [Paenibacillus sp. A3]|nr:hypothetical protein QJ48_20985 [Paenibacillus sp. A3]
MKKSLIILTTVCSMVAVSACSNAGSGSGNGNRASGSDGSTTTLPPPSTTEKKKIVFSTGSSHDYYKLAKQLYEAKHPNITIELQSYDGESEQDSEKYVKTTNTAMLSGKGPDLIDLDQLPLADYITKGLLTDMSKIIDKDPEFKKEDYFNNVLDGIKANGGIYGMPLYFFVYGLMGNQTFIEKSGVTFDDMKWTWADFSETAKQLTNNADKKYYRYALGGITPERMLSNFVNDQYASYVDQVNGKANFDTSNFIQMMKQVKSLYDNKIISSTEFSLIFKSVQINSAADYIRALRESEFLLPELAYKSKLYLSPVPKGGKSGATFRTYMMIGINNKSSVKPEAWDFVKFMVSEEMQSQAKSAGFSINKAAYKKNVKELLKTGKVESIQELGRMKDQVFEITQKDIDDLEKFVDGANYHVLEKFVFGTIIGVYKPRSTNKIDQIVQEESIAYFSGQKTPEAVAKLIQNRVTTVLNE